MKSKNLDRHCLSYHQQHQSTLFSEYMMTGHGEESLLEKLLKSQYPLTHYLHRQQQFNKAFNASPSSEPLKVVSGPPKTRPAPASAVSSFNVPDTLDPFASDYDHMNQSSKIDDDNSQDYDDTSLFKNTSKTLSMRLH